MKKTLWVTMLMALGAALPLQAAEISDAAFQVIATYPIAGDAKWDYLALDVQRHHLFVSRSQHVQVLDSTTGALIGDIPNTQGVHGIAIDQEDGLGFTSNGKAKTVTVFNLNDLKTVTTVKVTGNDPDAILYLPEFKQVYTFNGDGHNISVIDVPSYKVIKTIDIGATPEFGVDDHSGLVFFNIEDKSEIGVIDIKTGALIHRWGLPNCLGPTGLALDEKSQRLFSTCQNHQLSITDASTGKHVGNVVIGEHPDAVVFDAATKKILVSNGGGTLTVIQQYASDRYTVSQNLPTRLWAKTMAYEPGTQRVFLLGAALPAEVHTTKASATPAHLASLLVLEPK